MNRKQRRRTTKSAQGFAGGGTAEALQQAIRLHQRRQLSLAEAIYRQVLDSEPNNPSALHFLGVLLHQTGHSDAGIVSIRRALGLSPDYVDAWNNLGNVFKETGSLTAAADAYRKVIALIPRHAGALNNLGVVLRYLDQTDEAIAVLEKAALIAPNSADVQQNLGTAYQAKEKYSHALQAYRQSIQLNPLQKHAYAKLWRLLKMAGKKEEAGALLAQWVAADPNSPIARHHLQAWHGQDVPSRAPDDYIQQTFDGFAASFDFVLQRLDYRAPQLIAGAVARLVPCAAGGLIILDAGCGTGLCGPLLKPYAATLIGVDLSSEMLLRAKARKVGSASTYDVLVASDLVTDLVQSRRRDSLDLIVSADTLVYFGALVPFMRAAASALRAGGHVVFTVEEADLDQDRGFVLHDHGRYAHSRAYIENTLTDAGFSQPAIESVILRKEADEPVHGMLVSARLPFSLPTR